MTIFRRLSKNTASDPTDLEASPSPSAFWLGDFENKDNVVVSSHVEEDASSMTTVYSNPVADDLDGSERSLCLAQAFNEFTVKMDDKEDSVLISMDVPSDVPVGDLSVQVDDGILRVSGDVSEATDTVEQSFRLDEQSLDVNKMTANLSNGTLTITTPKKDSEDATLMESVPILTKNPPKVNAKSYKVVVVELPGVHMEDMHVSYANGKLRVAANRHFGRVRSFKRTIPVDVQKFDADCLKTYLHKGRLAIIVPPKEESELRTIEIETKGNSRGPRAA